MAFRRFCSLAVGSGKFFSISRVNLGLSVWDRSGRLGLNAVTIASMARFCHWFNRLELIDSSRHIWVVVRRSVQTDNTADIF